MDPGGGADSGNRELSNLGGHQIILLLGTESEAQDLIYVAVGAIGDLNWGPGIGGLYKGFPVCVSSCVRRSSFFPLHKACSPLRLRRRPLHFCVPTSTLPSPGPRTGEGKTDWKNLSQKS